MPSNTDKLVPVNQITITSPSICPMCGRSDEVLPYDIRLTKIEAKSEGWIAKGTGMTTQKKLLLPNQGYVKHTCPLCMSHYIALQHTIPVLCSPFQCPSCGEEETFRFSIHQLLEKEDEFEFEVELICKQCEKKKTLKKLISGFLSVIKLEVSPTGISVKNA